MLSGGREGTGLPVFPVQQKKPHFHLNLFLAVYRIKKPSATSCKHVLLPDEVTRQTIH